MFGKFGRVGAPAAADCSHARQLLSPEPAAAAGSCRRCDETGQQPVALRKCLCCGNVACCDSSRDRHATEHFQASGHAVMRSYEPGESWRWCYVDRRLV